MIDCQIVMRKLPEFIMDQISQTREYAANAGHTFYERSTAFLRSRLNRLGVWLVDWTSSPENERTPLAPQVDSQQECSLAAETAVEIPVAPNEHIVNVVAVCNVLAVLEGQIKDINQDVETSVAGVCKGFQGMAVRAQSAVSAASESISSGAKDSGGGKDMIAEMQKVLNSLLENVRSSSDFTQAVSEKLTSIESRLEAIEKTLGDVEELANKAKVVALNGQIEASRIGSAGLAFAVVARETKALSTNAASTSDAIRKLISKLTAEVKVTADEIRQRTDIDANRFVESEQQARELLHDIDVNHKQIVKSLNTTSEISGELRGDIARAVMSMQFQDRVSQRMAHVAETLEILVHEVDAKSFTYCEAEARGRSDQWLSQISKKYTMDSERIALSGDGELVTTATSSSDDFDVELF